MLQQIFDVLGNIVSFITGIVDFVLDFIRDLGYIISTISLVAGNFTTYISWLPAGMVIMIGILISIAVIYKVAGRD